MSEDRMILKEKIKLRKEIGLLEGAIDATKKSRVEKVKENAEVEKEIESVEGDNIKLEEQIQGLEDQIAELDTEFNEAQLTAGRLRKMMKRSTGVAEDEEKKIRQNTADLERLNETLAGRVDVELEPLTASEPPVDRREEHPVTFPLAGQIGGEEWTELVVQLLDRTAA